MRTFGVLILLLCAATVTGCTGQNTGRTTADSSKSDQAPTRRRAEAVLDSLARLVNADSLYALRRAMLVYKDTLALLNKMLCE